MVKTGNNFTLCFKCGKIINTDNQIYYVYIGKSSTEGNEPFCTYCYLQDIKDMSELDPFLTPLYAKNFIRMNK